MNQNQIILISGKQGSGKTTLAKAIYNKLFFQKRVEPVIMNFADPLYEMHNFCLGYLKSHGINRDIVKDGPLLQLLGTEWGRKTIDNNIWVNIMKNKIANHALVSSSYDVRKVFIIADCRFKNEIEGIPEALRIRLECTKEIRKKRCEAWRENDTHQSEIDLDDFYEYGFDLTFDTGLYSVEHCATIVNAQLDKSVWLEKRR